MEFRTTIRVDPSSYKIDYVTPVLFTGSCFANEIGKKMAEGKMKVMVNPAGTIYNPVSIGNTVGIAIENKKLKKDDLYFYSGKYLSFLHNTDFTSEDPDVTLEKINKSTQSAHEFLKRATFLIVTFGTSRVYRFKKSGEIVSNCHKLTGDHFTQELLTVGEIVKIWNDLLDRLKSFNGGIHVIFTISPVRHWKDGAHVNQVSKSVLFLAVEELVRHPVSAGYFPAYELLMDDLRDYRYYTSDMLHPSEVAVDYIWDTFAGCYFDQATMTIWREIYNISLAMKHRLLYGQVSATKQFAAGMLEKISSLTTKYPGLDFSAETDYFKNLI